MKHIIHNIFFILFLIVLIISGYMFISVVIYKNNIHQPFFTTWQFPMLFALFIDMCYVPKP